MLFHFGESATFQPFCFEDNVARIRVDLVAVELKLRERGRRETSLSSSHSSAGTILTVVWKFILITSVLHHTQACLFLFFVRSP